MFNKLKINKRASGNSLAIFPASLVNCGKSCQARLSEFVNENKSISVQRAILSIILIISEKSLVLSKMRFFFVFFFKSCLPTRFIARADTTHRWAHARSNTHAHTRVAYNFRGATDAMKHDSMILKV